MIPAQMTQEQIDALLKSIWGPPKLSPPEPAFVMVEIEEEGKRFLKCVPTTEAARYEKARLGV